MKTKGIKLKDRYPHAYRALKAELKKRMDIASLYAWRQLRSDPLRFDKDHEGLPILFVKTALKHPNQEQLQMRLKKGLDP